MSVRQSNKKVKTCPDATTTDCVKYVGQDIECLDVCYGDSLTSVQVAILDKLCELVGETNVSSIILPDCLKEAWTTNDPTILNFIQFLLDQHCVLQEQVDALPTTNDPIITLKYRCCEDGCVTDFNLKVSEHLQNIINCICRLNDRVQILENSDFATKNDVNDVMTAVDCLKGALITWNISHPTDQFDLSDCS